MLEILLKDTLVHVYVPSRRQTHHDIMPVRESEFFFFSSFYNTQAIVCVFPTGERLDVLKFSGSRALGIDFPSVERTNRRPQTTSFFKDREKNVEDTIQCWMRRLEKICSYNLQQSNVGL